MMFSVVLLLFCFLLYDPSTIKFIENTSVTSYTGFTKQRHGISCRRIYGH